MADPRPSVLFLGSTYAGHATRFANLRRHAQDDARIRASFRTISGWNERGLLERTPLVPAGLKGRARAVFEARPMVSLPRPDVIWTSGGEELAVYAPLQLGPWRRPVIFDLDATDAQLESMAPHYFHRPPKTGFRRKLSQLQERLIWSPVTLFTPWSNWAADGLRAEGIDDSRIRVAPPGISLDQWTPHHSTDTEGPLRLLFVGGDFARKGGQMLFDVFRTFPTGELTLDIVTREQVGELPPGVRVHRAEPNSEALKALYARAELFVLPTLAECFGIATIEAMASALPVIMSDVGGARDIVEPGDTGWLIEPTPTALAAALRGAQAQRVQLSAMGARGRAVVEQRFDG
ncbi:MAG: glycosyltransferase family 4 protein, partial [Tepidiformaceae bacterium]